MGGPPGAGKTLLARAVPSSLPPMTLEESLIVTKVFSVAGRPPPDTPLIRHRPFWPPHHTVSYAGLVGGGQVPRPGEISLAHNGHNLCFLPLLFSAKSVYTGARKQTKEVGRVRQGNKRRAGLQAGLSR
jgi:magnesium chelatase family protein